jgi:hypothetical protein
MLGIPIAGPANGFVDKAVVIDATTIPTSVCKRKIIWLPTIGFLVNSLCMV